MKLSRSLLFLLLLLCASGCSTFFGSTSSKEKTTSSSDSGPEALIQKTATGAEVTWEVPSEPTDGFIIRYGENPARLSKEVKILTAELQEKQDPEYGPVYRYIISDISADNSIYVSIAAFKGDAISDFSDVIQEDSKR